MNKILLYHPWANIYNKWGWIEEYSELNMGNQKFHSLTILIYE